MSESPAHPEVLTVGECRVGIGDRCDADLEVSQGYSGVPVVLPVSIWRGREPGPTVFVTAAVHGDELNGTGIVREILLNPPFGLTAGSLILVPVVNVLGLERHQRYLPDRRDLNRSFPGDPEGSLARRFAHAVFDTIVRRCDYGIDLHTAAVRRTNFPNARGDLRNREVARLAHAVGTELVINGKGPAGSLRRSACAAGCPTIILEAGEVWKIEPTVVEFGVRGIRNVLIELGMVQGERSAPAFQTRIDKTKWVRAEVGGILQFHVAPGDVVEKGQILASSTNFLGRALREICSPADGVVIGMTTLPAVSPGSPVCHLAIPKKGIQAIRDARERASAQSLLTRVREDLSTSVAVSEPHENEGGGPK